MELLFFFFFLNQTLFRMLLDVDMVHSEVPHYSESPPPWKRPDWLLFRKNGKKKKPQRVQFGFCVLWRLKLFFFFKKKKKKKSTSVFQEQFGCFSFVLTQQTSPLFSNLLLVARYCRLKDLLLDSRSGGCRFERPLLVPRRLLKGLYILLTSTWSEDKCLFFIKHCYQSWRTVVAENDATWPHTCTSSWLQKASIQDVAVQVWKERRPNYSMSAPLDPPRHPILKCLFSPFTAPRMDVGATHLQGVWVSNQLLSAG